MAAAVAGPGIPARTPTPPQRLTIDTALQTSPPPFPKKHIPYCSPGAQPGHGFFSPMSLVFGFDGTLSPPASPRSGEAKIKTTSILFPPDKNSLINESPPVYALPAATLAEAVEHVATQPLPNPDLVFPWFHGLHAENHMQLSFFTSRRKTSLGVPKCLRGLTIVKAGGDLSFAKLKGAISPHEILGPCDLPGDAPSFLDIDPKIGFSVRNFHIQACKMATVSDVVVYGDDTTAKTSVEELAKMISQAQAAWRQKLGVAPGEQDAFHTFVVTDSFSDFEVNHPAIVAVDSQGSLTGKVLDFFHQERIEMHSLTKASEIANNVWLGPTPDANLSPTDITTGDEDHFDLLIEGSDFARMPDAQSLEGVENFLNENDPGCCVAYLDFPASGSISAASCSAYEVERLVATCQFIYKLANPIESGDGDKSEGDDAEMHDAVAPPRKILIHCADGYTETTLLGIAYVMFAENLTAHEAWKLLHIDKKRNFFAYSSDKAFLERVERRMMESSPVKRSSDLNMDSPLWMERMDGSFPSRIMPYLYLGNLSHANNPGLLRELGIGRVLSVGEPLSWLDDDPARWGQANFLFVDRVQDNGVDPLTKEFDRCLEFIREGREKGTATLVHCRVGVSRSATICLAEVMRELGYSFPQAYCFVRARRLNVIIQPHLRFVYELLKWEEVQRVQRGLPLRRELEWASVAREISLMNKPYCRQ